MEKSIRKLSRRVIVMLACLIMTMSMFGCGKTKKEDVSITVWGPASDQEMLKEMAESFKKEYGDKANITITISEESEVTCKETVLINPQSAADVYIFADDQFDTLVSNNALHEVTVDTDTIINDNGGKDSAAILAASRDNKLYAYPMTASNGYFLYYNNEYFTEEDVKDFDKMLEIAEANNKKIAMDFTSGWYLYSFFKGAGLNVEITEDGSSNICDWNTKEGKYTGLDVAEAMCKIASHKGFLNCGDEDFVNGAKDGDIIAGINGAWNANNMKEAYGEHYAATMLPGYTLSGDLVQMHSFAGYKLVGVNAYTKQEKWAQLFAQWITNEENQMKRFKANGEGPSNVKAAASEEVLASPAIAALTAQSKYAHIQRVGDGFWMPVYVYGTTIMAGNLDEKDLQELLDQMVEDITSVSN